MSRYYIGSWSYYVAMYNSWDIIWESGRGRGKGEGEGRGEVFLEPIIRIKEYSSTL